MNTNAVDRNELALVIGLVAMIPLLLVPLALGHLTEHRKNRNETQAIGALKAIGSAQALFREADKDGDGSLDYGTLAELGSSGTTGLIDAVLASGTKDGYLFEATYGATTSEFIWYATARPVLPGVSGDRYFATNHEGVTFATTEGAFSLDNVDCQPPVPVRVRSFR
jgi:hypothetical protein